MQPKWRLLEDGTLLRKLPDTGEEWDTLRQGGPNGFFTIILAFSWWIKAVDDDTGLCDALDHLDDLKWVVTCITDMSPIPGPMIGRKRAQQDEPDTLPKSQRYVLIFPPLLLKLMENCHRRKKK